MTEQTENIVLEILKRMQVDMREMRSDMLDLKHRISAIELHIGELATSYAGQSIRLDRFDERLARIERRLDLIETPQ